MKDRDYIIKEGQVVLVENLLEETNETCGMRIKVRITEDGNTPIENLPWCTPLMPKTFQSVPKVGEGALVLASEIENYGSNRFYLGPIISQPQYNEYCPYNYGIGPAMALLQGGSKESVLKKISKFEETKGSFPEPNDIAVIGRKGEDIVLKDDEIDLRCGIRVLPFKETQDLKGRVIFNTNSPSYLQLKFKNGGITHNEGREANSLINLVADRINLISHKDVNAFRLTDNKELIPESELDEIMDKLHELPYGDILVKYLKIMQKAILYHGHNYGPATPPIRDRNISQLADVDFDETLSDKVRIS